MRHSLIHFFCCIKKITMFPFPFLWFFNSISSKSMQVSPCIYNISRFFHLSPTSFATRRFHTLKSLFQKKAKFHLRNKRGKVSGSFVIFTGNGASGWHSHFLYCSLSRLTPVIRLRFPDWRCDAARETSLPLPSNCTKNERMHRGFLPPFLTTGSKVRGLQWKGLEQRETEYFKVHDPIRDVCAVHIINVKVAKQQRVKYLAAQIGSLRYSASRFRTYNPSESDEKTAAFSKIDDITSRSEHKLLHWYESAVGAIHSGLSFQGYLWLYRSDVDSVNYGRDAKDKWSRHIATCSKLF